MKKGILAALLTGGFMIVASAQEVILFEGSMKDAWTVANWGGATLTAIDDPAHPGKRKILKFSASNEAKPWAGAHFTTIEASKPDVNAPALTDALKESGKLTFIINGSEDEWGTHRGEQAIQISLGQRKSKEGDWTMASFVPIAPFIDGQAIDSNPATWQKVSIPLSKILPKNATCIGVIGFQFIDAPSPAGVLIDKIRIEP